MFNFVQVLGKIGFFHFFPWYHAIKWILGKMGPTPLYFTDDDTGAQSHPLLCSSWQKLTDCSTYLIAPPLCHL